MVTSTWGSWIEEFKKTKLTPSLNSTLILFQKSLSPKEIATQKDVKEETIERQIHILLAKNLLHIDDVVQKEIQNNIKESIQNLEEPLSLSKLKESLDSSITYFCIKAVLASEFAKPKLYK